MPTAEEREAAGEGRPQQESHLDEQKRQILEGIKGMNGLDGLDDEEVKQRTAEFGPNELVEKKESAVIKFLRYFWGPIPFMIEIAAILSAVLQHWADLAIVLFLLVVNAIIGFYEEKNAGDAIEALKAVLPSVCRVKRNGQWQNTHPRNLVPGDRIFVKGGDSVPADAIIISLPENETLEIDQSALTGESLPVHKVHGDLLYSSSVVRTGEAEAIVTATGRHTFMGETAKLVQSAVVSGHFQKVLVKIGNFLIIFDAALCLLIIIFAIWRHQDILMTLQFCLVLTIASIPVALPTVMSVTLAVGARAMAKESAIVARLTAIEELAGVDVLCSDKTGTLTTNQLTLDRFHTTPTTTEDELLMAAACASNWKGNDALDIAVINAYVQRHREMQREMASEEQRQQPEQQRRESSTSNTSAHPTQAAAVSAVYPPVPGCEQLAFKPFNPVWKRTEARVRMPDGTVRIFSKGAPQVIATLVRESRKRDPEVLARLEALDNAVKEMAKHGLRAIGVAEMIDGRWHLLGAISLIDPPREDSAFTIQKLKELGISTKMITGDQATIGAEVARRLGLGGHILSAAALEEELEAGGDISHKIEEADGFGEVFPAHKHAVVRALQKRKHLVAMTGDGVNDAPALKQANVGIAVAGATDAARAASDLVLLAPGLSVIVNAIILSRQIFARMLSYAHYRIMISVHMLVFLTIAILAFRFTLPAILVVLIALLNDFSILAISTDRLQWSKTPVKWRLGRVMLVSTCLGGILVFSSFLMLFLATEKWQDYLSLPQVHTLMYLQISISGHLVIFSTRIQHGSFLQSFPSLIFLVAILGTQVVATFLAVYASFLLTPIPWAWAGIVWAYSIITLLVVDACKEIMHLLITEHEDADEEEDTRMIGTRPFGHLPAGSHIQSLQSPTVQYRSMRKQAGQTGAAAAAKMSQPRGGIVQLEEKTAGV